MRQSIIAPIIVLAGWASCQNVSALTFDFAVNDGGFVSSGSTNWNFTGAQWETVDVNDRDAFLTSPVLTAIGPSTELSVTHSYDFENTDVFFDGGRLDVLIRSSASRSG